MLRHSNIEAWRLFLKNIFHLFAFSFQDQDQGGEAREHGPQGDPAEEEEDVESREPEEEGHEEVGAVP